MPSPHGWLAIMARLDYNPPMDDVTAHDGVTRFDWHASDIQDILQQPLLSLIDRARAVHLRFHEGDDIQRASLLSVKTGGCPEDCRYCSQSAHHETDVGKQSFLGVDDVLASARRAGSAGATRFCMGAAWRSVKEGEEFEALLAMIKGVRRLGMEACVTLGMVNESQAQRLKEAGLTAYNHNIDTSPEFYDSIITTRRFDDRLRTLRVVRDAGLEVCSGGIVGLGESWEDRASMLAVLASLNPHPESVPINALVAVEGTPLQDAPPVDDFVMVRMVAAARITMPESRVRLSAGRKNMSKAAQTLCFLAGANSIFYGDQLLTTANNDALDDQDLFAELGLH